MSLPRRIVVVALLGALALLLAASAGAGAAAPTPPTHKPVKVIRPPARVKVGRVEPVETAAGRPALLVAVRYPIQAAGRGLRLGVRIQMSPGTVPLATVVAHRLSAGQLRRPETRRGFTFVHEIRLKPQVARALREAWAEGRAPLATVEAQSGIDIDADGKPEIRSKGVPRRIVRLAPPRAGGASASASASTGEPFCSSVPLVQVAPRETVAIPLPTCDRPQRWSVTAGAGAGTVRLRDEEVLYTAPAVPGPETIRISHATTMVVKVVRPWSPIGAPGSAGPVVRAMGDSVTAGFGYYSDGKLMPFLSLYECKPVGTVLDDACSSNSTATKNGLKEVPYAPDYGLADNVSWAAQWANAYGVTNYKNLAVSGSEPTNWAPGGSLYSTTQKIEAEDPDYILMTIGANPILANTLFGLGSMRCALESALFGGYQECVEEAFEEVHLRAELKRLYANLVANTDATIYLMQYHLSIPSSALAYGVGQIAEMGKLMNETIAAVAGEVNAATKSQRLQVVSPPHFDVGVSLEPVYPSSYTCSYFEYGVDGPSVQSTPTQDELEAAHYLSFCGGPKGGGEPWVISGDTGIHPSAAGYAQMASQVPPPVPPG
ncbi:MAG TPA: SGNH/GDSL hydrolase family protein [Solirubrobacterales bacterium]|nr:SGNH/GDSL hydrolase family protein [Solirubrobacterales bacterium]